MSKFGFNKSFLVVNKSPSSLFCFCCSQVSAYGFMTDDYAKYSNYYFENAAKTRVIFYANHDYILEKNTWKKLHDSKIMKLYQRPNTETVTEKPK